MSASTLFRALLRPRLAPPARAVHSRPQESPVGPLASAVGLSAFFLGLLVPSGWILANLEHYKKRD